MAQAIQYLELGLLRMVQNDLVGAEILFCQALNLRPEIGQLEGVLWAMEGLAVVALKQAQYSEAQQMMEEAQLLQKAILAPILPHSLKYIVSVHKVFLSTHFQNSQNSSKPPGADPPFKRVP